MKLTHLVLRTLADAALEGDRRWESIPRLAYQASCSPNLAASVIGRLARIGAVRKYPSGGMSVVDPERIVAILAAERNIHEDTWGLTSRDGARALLALVDDYAIGGMEAAVHHLGGSNTIADTGQSIVYVWFGQQDERSVAEQLGDGDDVRLMVMDKPAWRAWRGFSSFSQTCADLFAQPGWQASEFRRALWKSRFLSDDWTQRDDA